MISQILPDMERRSLMTGTLKLSNKEREKRMWEKIQAGESIETFEEMSDDYLQNLVDLMLQQADSELAAALAMFHGSSRHQRPRKCLPSQT